MKKRPPVIASCLIGLFLALTLSINPINNAHAFFEPDLKIEILDICKDAYEYGKKVYIKSIIKLLKDSGNYYSRKMKKIYSRCHFAYSMGIFVTNAHVTQRLLVEYLFELKYAQGENQAYKKSLKEFYRKKLIIANLDPGLLIRMETYKEYFDKYYKLLLKHVKNKAYQDRKAVPFGRFIVTHKRVYTIYDYVRNEVGGFKLDKEGSPKSIEGSYIRLAKKVYKKAVKAANEYLEWRPSSFWGEDSFWYGHFSRGRDDKTIREIKEESYFKSYEFYMKWSKELLMDQKVFQDMHNKMFEKQRAFYDRDISSIKLAQIGVWSSFFVIGGMVVCKGILGFVGLKSVAMGTAAFKISSSSLIYSSNIAAFGALLGIVGMTSYGVISTLKEYKKQGLPITFTNFMDTFLTSSLASFPMGAFVPVAIGTIAYGGKVLFLSIKTILTGMITGVKTAKVLGFKGTLKVLPKLPLKAIKVWGTAWWKKKILFLHFGVDAVSFCAFEIGSREILMDGESKFFLKDKDGNTYMNKAALYSIGNHLILNALTKPIPLVKNFIHRFLLYRAFDLVTGPLTSLVVYGKVDKRRLGFDMAFNSTVSTGLGELNRAIRFSKYTQNMGLTKQFAFLLLVKFALKFKTPVKNILLDAYMNRDRTAIGNVKYYFKKYCLTDIDDYTYQEIIEVFANLDKDPKFQKMIKNIKLKDS